MKNQFYYHQEWIVNYSLSLSNRFKRDSHSVMFFLLPYNILQTQTKCTICTVLNYQVKTPSSSILYTYIVKLWFDSLESLSQIFFLYLSHSFVYSVIFDVYNKSSRYIGFCISASQPAIKSIKIFMLHYVLYVYVSYKCTRRIKLRTLTHIHTFDSGRTVHWKMNELLLRSSSFLKFP